MSSRPGSQRTETRPYDEQMPYLQDIFEQSQLLSDRNVPFYPGQTYAPSNSLHDTGFGNQIGVAEQYGDLTNLAGQRVSQLADYAAGQVAPTPTVDPSQRLREQLSGQVNLGPYNQVADAITRRTMDAVDTQVRDNDQLAAMMGQSGSSRHGVAEGILRSNAQDSLTNSLADMYLGAYEGGQNRATQGVSQAADLYGRAASSDAMRLGSASNLYGMIPQFGQSQLQFAGMPLTAGDFYRNEQQMGIDEAMARYNYEAEQPWSNLERYAALVHGSPMGTTTNASVPSNRFGSAAGGAMMGAQMGSMMGAGGAAAGASTGSMAGPYGALIGAGLGYLLG